MLKDIVLKQKLKKEELLKSQYVDRTKEPFAKKWLDSNLIKVVLGPRRAGKSVFSMELATHLTGRHMPIELISLLQISTK